MLNQLMNYDIWEASFYAYFFLFCCHIITAEGSISATGGSTGSSQGTRRTFAAKFSNGKVGKSVVPFPAV